ncbi:aldehyde dehydrogenase family protein, partial [Klebsiella variicola]|uniref:aldehyde dehydrogenase family protein n=3 Tax=Enterobacterales TaxID=91347 RepID=UPI0013D6C57D
FTPSAPAEPQPVRNPANHHDIVGHVRPATEDEVDHALATASGAAEIWFATPAQERADILIRAAQLMEDQLQPLLGILVRE